MIRTCRHCGRERSEHRYEERGGDLYYCHERRQQFHAGLTRDELELQLKNLSESFRKQREGTLALYRVFEAAATLSDAWPGSSPNWIALRDAVEAYRELVAPLGEQSGK
jgi:hypothetical protein